MDIQKLIKYHYNMLKQVETSELHILVNDMYQALPKINMAKQYFECVLILCLINKVLKKRSVASLQP